MSKVKLSDLRREEAELRKLISLAAITAEPLYSDFNFAVSQWRNDKSSQFWSRTSIRCLCAAIEATLFTHRQMAQKMATLSKIQFDVAEIEILTEQKKRVDSKGVETIRPKWLQFPDSVKESFRLFGKAVGATIQIDYSAAGFLALRQVFEIRNRLMHPKQPFDVEVRINDTNNADRAIAWFQQARAEVLKQTQAQIDKNVRAELSARTSRV